MRKCFLVFAFLIACRVGAQRIGDLSVPLKPRAEEAFSLDSGWKFSPLDDPHFSEIEAADSTWQTLNINQPASLFLKATHGGKGWLRRYFSLDTSFEHRSLSLLLSQLGASQVFVDGQLVKSFGTIAPQQVTPFNPHDQPLPLLLLPAATHLLCLRFATCAPSSEWLRKRATTRALTVKLQSTTSAIADLQSAARQMRSYYAFVYVSGVFGVLFFLVFLFYPRQPLTLYFSLYNLFLAIGNALRIYLAEGHYGLGGFVETGMLVAIFERATGASAMAFVAFAECRRIPAFFRWLIICTLLDFFLLQVLPQPYPVASQTLHVTFMFAFLWLMIGAVQKLRTTEGFERVKNIFVCFMALFSFLVNLNFFLKVVWGIDSPYFLNAFLQLQLPAMIIYLALEQANITGSLQRQLLQVKTLSEENLRKEQEKQQILTGQKQLLEQEVNERTAALNKSLQELKATQQQLIHQEKMASLGELTAGIAHEIQNPLNFVNNFSETNAELLAELKREVQVGNTNEVIALAEDLEKNQQKITLHGKRAESIVKGMLQHARASSGTKEPTDINKLAEEYLRLSYQGMRAKDKDFSATIETHFDETISRVSVVPQDIGRVLLNLFNNAFYTVNEKKRNLNGTFEPVVEVITKREGDNVIVTVKDNGTGITQKNVDKIFQPFFTTKPTGEGTGLGLSLSYDIVTKGHGGTLTVHSTEGEGSEFVVQLPMQIN